MSEDLKQYPQMLYHILGQSLHQFVAGSMDEATFRKGLLEVRATLSGLQNNPQQKESAADGFEQFEWAIKLLEEFSENDRAELMKKSEQAAQEGRSLLAQSLGLTEADKAKSPPLDSPSWKEALESRGVWG